MVKGAWWHSMHLFFSAKANLSFARKVGPRFIVPVTFGAESAAATLTGRTMMVTTAERQRMAALQVGVARIDKGQDGRWAAGNRITLPGRKAGCHSPIRFSASAPSRCGCGHAG